MVIVCGIVAVLSISVYMIFVNGNRLFTLQNNLAIAENQALKASLVIERELREARAPEGLNLQAIEQADEQSIIFYADITDEPVNNREEKIQYLLNNGYLLRGIAYWNQEIGDYDDLPDLISYTPSAPPNPTPSTSLTPTPTSPPTSAAPSYTLNNILNPLNYWLIPAAKAQSNPPPTDSVPPSGSPSPSGTPTPSPSTSGSPSPSLSPSPENIKVLAQFVVNGSTPIFYYYDQYYTGSQNPMSYPINLGSVKVIKIYLVIDVNSRPPEPYVHETTIQLRNPNL